MKKFAALLLLLPTVLMTISGAANAQRKNTTSHDVKPKTACVCEGQKDCPCMEQMKKDAKKHHKDKKHDEDKKHHKDKKNHEKKMSYADDIDGWVVEQTDEINEDFRKIMKKINKSELTKENSAKLQKMAEANKTAAQKHLNETAALIKKNHQNCMSIAQDNHKLCKQIDKLLLAD